MKTVVCQLGGTRQFKMTPFQLVCAVALMAGVASATVAVHVPCGEISPDLCSVEQVRIDPCIDPKSCRLRKGFPASISFDFTPNFSATKLKTGLFWASDNGDVAFTDLYEADACGMTTCPTTAGKSQELSYSLKLNKLLPQGTYDFKWKVWNEDDIKQVCCFKTQVKLRK